MVAVILEGGRRKHADKGFAVSGTDGLLAVTQVSHGGDWSITHVSTGLCFPGAYFSSQKLANKVAIELFRWYPEKQLSSDDPEEVTRGLSREDINRFIGGILKKQKG